MGYSFRKSIKIGGGTRLNLSKSGVGVSYGIKGFRVSSNSKGSMLYAGRRGVYYRKKLSTGRNNSSNYNEFLEDNILEDILDIEDDFESFLSLDEKYISEQFVEIKKRTNFLCLLFWGCLISGFYLWFIPWFVGAFIGYKKSKELDNYKLKGYDDSSEEHIKIFKQISNNEKYYNPSSLNKYIVNMEKSPYILKYSPSMIFDNNKLYFLTEGVFCLVANKNGYFIPYSDIELQKTETKAMTLNPPTDAEIINTTWEHANKDGSPNKRYKVNREVFEVKAYVTNLICKDNFVIPVLSLTQSSSVLFFEYINKLKK